MNAVPRRLTFSRGFTLIELALVLVIVAIFLGGMLMTMGAQDENRRYNDTRATMATAQEALLGYAAAHGRLPCPASAASNGLEDPVGGGACTASANMVALGFVPAATLGLAPIDNAGRLVDGWGIPLRYAVTAEYTSAATTVDGIKGKGMANITNDLLIVCSSGSSGAGMVNEGTATADCPAGSAALTKTAVAVLYSLGKNAASGGGGADERHNPNPNSVLANDRAFVSHEPAPADAPGGQFDDIMVWLSPNILYNRMIAAGKLP